MPEFIAGKLEPYYEQGYEGMFQYTFVPLVDAHLVNGGRGYFLRTGDQLRIFATDDELIWSGGVELVPSKLDRLIFPDRHRLEAKVWATEKQKRVKYADWIGWFWACLLYTSPSPRDQRGSRMPSSA